MHPDDSSFGPPDLPDTRSTHVETRATALAARAVAAWLLVSAIAALIESLRVPGELLFEHASLALRVFVLEFLATAALLGPIFITMWFALQRACGWPRASAAAFALGLVSWCYLWLCLDERLFAYPPLLACLGGYGAAVAGFVWLHFRGDDLALRGGWRWLGRGSLLLGAGVVYMFNTQIQVGFHPAFHMCLHLIVLGALFVVITSFEGMCEPSFSVGRLLFGGALQLTSGSQMPRLPDDWRLNGKNILLVTVEAMRHDQSSLGAPGLDTTPQLAALAARPDALVFTSANAPAAATFQSMSSPFSMVYPSAAPVEVGPNDWMWRLHVAPNISSVPASLRAAGYETFWTGHNYKGVFEEMMSGLERGFDTVDLVPFGPGPEDADVDIEIAERALARLQRVAHKDAPFFGWVFLASPHHAYYAHDASREGANDLERYRDELRFADAQLGRITEQLCALGLMDNTVIMVTGDHGEEFFEHGSETHARHVHPEIRNVPLVVIVPGIERVEVKAPVSTLCVFPWLFERAQGEPRAHATWAVHEVLAPTLVVTGGAVVSEVLGAWNMRSALIYRDHSVVYDYWAQRVSLYDLRQDPGEGHDLSLKYRADDASVRETFEAFRKERRRFKRFALVHD